MRVHAALERFRVIRPVEEPRSNTQGANAVTISPCCAYFAGLGNHDAVHPQLQVDTSALPGITIELERDKTIRQIRASSSRQTGTAYRIIGCGPLLSGIEGPGF